jgi:FkbH-like protein
MGKLLPRDDPRNLVFIVESLNHHLVTLIGSTQNAYYLDIDQIASGIGKQFIQDDVINAISHGGFLSNFDFSRDQDRIEPPKPLGHYFDIRAGVFRASIWAELQAMFRTVQQADQVKLVIVDLDDTLWRGIIAEEGDRSDDTIEGWPMGIIEALQFLRKRGVLLGIISKNDESRIEALWDGIFRGRLRLDEFVVRKINWRPKAENLEEILEEVNLLSRSVVFVDDNPVERAGIAAAFPDVRVLGSELYQLRRILMWAPETQVSFVSDESGRRTRMVEGQVARERERKRIPREEFLEGLAIKVRMFNVLDEDRASAARAVELLNKTNQFNTTGRRWKAEDLQGLCGTDGSVIGFEVQDRFTDYGMVGVIVLRHSSVRSDIEQVVMSCRVFGLDVELAVLTELINLMQRSNEHRLTGVVQKRSENQPCWDLFQRLGFVETNDEIWADHGGFISTRQFSASVEWKERAARSQCP